MDHEPDDNIKHAVDQDLNRQFQPDDNFNHALLLYQPEIEDAPDVQAGNDFVHHQLEEKELPFWRVLYHPESKDVPDPQPYGNFDNS